MLQFSFMRNALLAGFMLSVIIPMIGVVMVNRKTSMIGDALSHTSLAGVAIGLIAGINPIIGAIIICVFAAFSIEFIRNKFPHYGDMATAVIMSSGLGFAAILTKFAPGGNNFESYLFGSISSVTQADVISVVIIFIPIVIASFMFYSALLDIAIDTNMARLAGVKVRMINSIFTFLTSITVALSCKIVGALLVSSLIVLPVATSLIISTSYKMTFITSILLGVIYMMSGILMSYYFDVPTGGAIVIIAVLGMVGISIYKKIKFKSKNIAN